jgi:hypothetical protein
MRRRIIGSATIGIDIETSRGAISGADEGGLSTLGQQKIKEAYAKNTLE